MVRLKHYAKTAVCMALSAALVLADAPAVALAAGQTAAEEQSEGEAESGLQETKTTEEAATESDATGRTAEEASGEESVTETAATGQTAEETSSEESVTEGTKETGETQTQDDIKETEETQTEERVPETGEVQDTETDLETETSTESETETEEGLQKLAFSGSDIDHGIYEDITWVIDADGKLTIEGTGNFHADYNDDAPWHENRQFIKSAVVNVTGMTDTMGMFEGCENLESVDVKGFDTSSVTYMGSMFYDCKSLKNLKNLDQETFNTSKVRGMCFMFKGCESLESVDVSKFDTSKVTDMCEMFGGCKSLTTLDVSKFDTSKVTDMSYMFRHCESLTTLDVSKFDTQNVTDMEDMFKGCKNVKSLDVSEFNTSKVTTMYGMFSSCSSLTSLDVTNFDTQNVTSMLGMFGSCSGLTTLDVSAFNTENVTDMWGMFGSCSNLTSLDLSGFNTSKVTKMSRMFQNCTNLKNLIITSDFDTQNVTEIYGMFDGCKSLTSLDVSKFNTENVTDMSYMFEDCGSLESLNVSSFNTQNVTKMVYMFNKCSSLKSLDVSSFKTGQVTDMMGMFEDCSALTNLNVSSFDTSQVTIMNSMFRNCSQLTDLDVSGFNVSYGTQMASLFEGCSALTSLDMSGFNAGQEETEKYNTWNLLSGCNALTTIYTPYNVTDSISLPRETNEIWYDKEGTEYKFLPQNEPLSILLSKNSTPSTETKLTAAVKKSYICGETVSKDDFIVRYYGSDGTVKTLSPADYTISPVDTSTEGSRTLTITYGSLTAKVTISIKKPQKTEVTITGIKFGSHTYNKEPVTYTGGAVVKTGDGTDVTDKVKAGLLYTYTCIKEDGTPYAPTETAPTNAGSYKLTVSVSPDNADYTGSREFPFTIAKAPITVTARNMELVVGAKLPEKADYEYGVTGLVKDDVLTTEPELTCSITSTAEPGTYDIIPSGADAGANYTITYKNGKLTVKGIGDLTEYCTVAFDLSGKGVNFAYTEVKKGSRVDMPEDPKAEGFKFTGWYKDQACTEKWDFAKDTVQKDTTLYAGWIERMINDRDDSAYEDGERIDLSSQEISVEIAKIKPRVYDGTPYEPAVKVTVKTNGKKQTLTEGADYRVSYESNINVGTAKVTVKGNGIYNGSKTSKYEITGKSVKKLKVVTGSITDSIKNIDLKKLPVYVYDGTRLLRQDEDYKLVEPKDIKSGAQVTVSGTGNYKDNVTAKLSIYEPGTKIIGLGDAALDGLDDGTAEYTGKAVKPRVTVTVDGETLSTKSYKVQYQNNVNAGTAFAIITGKSGYKGKVVVPFTIKTAEVQEDKINIKDIKPVTYNGKYQKPAVTVTVPNGTKTKKLVKNKDYTIIYDNNLHALKYGENAKVIIKGKGNYAGINREATFTINQQQIKKASVKGTQGALTLTYAKRVLKEGEDYKITYGEVNKNKIKVTIEGIGDFKGSVTKTVKAKK